MRYCTLMRYSYHTPQTPEALRVLPFVMNLQQYCTVQYCTVALLVVRAMPVKISGYGFNSFIISTHDLLTGTSRYKDYEYVRITSNA